MENMNNCCNYSAGSSMVRDALLIWTGGGLGDGGRGQTGRG